ncbi:tetratricopeptide repeat protein [Plantactinospora sonchi]|uniref:Tetratricopeptide repeat protein n=1 Tax=Plantactinospora sonchi TaxID=1544735 RepID=A0ABU7RLR8_9ACTN
MDRRRDAPLRELRARLDRFLATGDVAGLSGPDVDALVIAVSTETTGDSADFLDVVLLLGWLRLGSEGLLAPGAPLPDLPTTAQLLAPVYRTAPQSLPTLLLVTVGLLTGQPNYDAPQRLFGRAVNLMTHGRTTGDVVAVSQAINLFLDAVEASPVDSADRAGILSNVCLGWLTVYELTNDRSALDHAVRTGEEAAQALLSTSEHRAETLNNLAVALRIRTHHTGDHGDLDRAVALFAESVARTAPDDAERAVRQNNLGIALGVRFERLGQPGDLDQAITALQQALDGTGPHRAQRPGFAGDLAYHHWVRYQHTGDRTSLDRAAELFEVAATSRDDGFRQRARAYLDAVRQEQTNHPGPSRHRP